jgi:predicted RND superfamily exporter protein
LAPICSASATSIGIEAWVPVFLFAVLFGLSMDYQVFLLSRIQERYRKTGNTADGIVYGVASTARLITGAALIIIVLFSGFATGQLVDFQQMGFGVAVALLVDATVLRLVIIPAVMGLLGERNWYLARWLNWLPRVQIEQPAAPVEPQRRSRSVRQRADHVGDLIIAHDRLPRPPDQLSVVIDWSSFPRPAVARDGASWRRRLGGQLRKPCR